jgi:hypothetical protein
MSVAYFAEEEQTLCNPEPEHETIQPTLRVKCKSCPDVMAAAQLRRAVPCMLPVSALWPVQAAVRHYLWRPPRASRDV